MSAHMCGGVLPAQPGRCRSSAVRRLALGATLATSLGCYKYVPTTMESVPVGANVRAALSAEAQDDLRSRIGMDIDVLQGKVLEENGDQVLISVPTVQVASAYGAQSLHQRIDVSRRNIVRVDVRRLDKPRTYGLIGIAAGAAAFVTAQLFIAGDPGSPNPPNNPPSDRRQGFVFWVPVLRW